MMLRHALVLVALVIAPTAHAAAQTPPAGRTPTAQLALGFNGPQYPTAEFPGLTAAIAVLFPIQPSIGIGLVAEGDASYSRLSRTVGPRISYGHKRAKVFAQFLAGTAKATDQGIIHATGGRQLQPGIGVGINFWRFGIQFEVDHRTVKGGADTNTRTNEVTSWSGQRTLVAFTIALGTR